MKSNLSTHIEMKEKDLKDMTQSEMIALVMKLNKTLLYKHKHKPKKANNNIESLFDDDNQASYIKLNKIDKLMNNVHKSDKKIKKIDNEIQNKYNTFSTQKTDVINYIKKDVSLNRFRIHEARLSKTMRKKNSSFQKLFEKRLLNIKGSQERISITLDVDILNGLIITEKNIWTIYNGYTTVKQ